MGSRIWNRASILGCMDVIQMVPAGLRTLGLGVRAGRTHPWTDALASRQVHHLNLVATVIDEGTLAQLLRTRMSSLRRIPILSPVSCNPIPGQLSLLTLGTSNRSAHRCCSHRSHVAHRNHWRATQRSPIACTLLGPPSALFHHTHPTRLLRLRPRKHEPRR